MRRRTTAISDVSFEEVSDDEAGSKRPLPPPQQQQYKVAVPSSATTQQRAPSVREAALDSLAPQQSPGWLRSRTLEVDATARKLLGNIAATAPGDDDEKDGPWQPEPSATVNQEKLDPLGFGRLDFDTLQLVSSAAGVKALVLHAAGHFTAEL